MRRDPWPDQFAPAPVGAGAHFVPANQKNSGIYRRDNFNLDTTHQAGRWTAGLGNTAAQARTPNRAKGGAHAGTEAGGPKGPTAAHKDRYRPSGEDVQSKLLSGGPPRQTPDGGVLRECTAESEDS